MKERIKQLAIEANLISPESNGFDQTRLSIAQQRFAELIVKECLTFCEYQGDRFDEYDSGMTERARIIRESIQKHFGVKE
jgi:hypothetical protein